MISSEELRESLRVKLLSRLRSGEQYCDGDLSAIEGVLRDEYGVAPERYIARFITLHITCDCRAWVHLVTVPTQKQALDALLDDTGNRLRRMEEQLTHSHTQPWTELIKWARGSLHDDLAKQVESCGAEAFTAFERLNE